MLIFVKKKTPATFTGIQTIFQRIVGRNNILYDVAVLVIAKLTIHRFEERIRFYFFHY
ncbi:unnamed protein product [marine sediment metagenome]|uniref:Uncharacterized protein n=1 Tax=marine sediment metagenome TaxID=412755 RepID=X1PNG2_9ZZZZ